jgi:ABC-type lipoprotein release transport system permease subunit
VSGVVTRLRVEFRARWYAWLAVALVAGIGAGAVIGLLAGARRTERAYPHMLQALHASDVLLAGQNRFGLIGSVDLDKVEKLPEVEQASRVSVPLLFSGSTNHGQALGPAELFPFAHHDDELGRTIEQWKILDGRAADPNVADEATASFMLARQLHLHVGDTIRLHFVKGESFGRVAAQLLQFGARLANAPGSENTRIDRLADGPDITFHIVGIEAAPDEFPPIPPDVAPPLHLTPAFTRLYAAGTVFTQLEYVTLHDHSQLTQFSQDVERLAQGQPVGFITSQPTVRRHVQRSSSIEANALRLLALLTVIALVVVLTQTIVRQVRFAARDDSTLSALGMTRRELMAIALARGALIGTAAAVVATVMAVALSPLMPIGLARTAELDPGISFDWLALAIGFVATIALVVLLTLFATWRVMTRTAALSRRPQHAATTMGSHVPPTASVGLHLALDRSGPGGGAGVWTAVLSVSVSIALLAGIWGFRTSMQRLIDTPHYYGQNWDVKTGAAELPSIGDVLVPPLTSLRTVEAVAAGTVSQVEIHGQRVDVLAMDDVKGHVAPTVLEGRLPRRASEVLVGSKTLALAGAHVGDHIGIEIGNTTARMRVVGVGVFPEFGDAGQLGDGALMTYQGLERALPNAKENTFLIRFHKGVDVTREMATLRRSLDPVPSSTAGRPRDLQELADVQSLPVMLAIVIALLAAATLVHALAASIRRRRRDLAVLKTMGFMRHQLAFAVMWQTTALVGVSLLIGLPLGLLLGRYVWNVFAVDLGTVSNAAVPIGAALIAVPVALLLGNVVAAIPAWLAGRVRPASALRSE